MASHIVPKPPHEFDAIVIGAGHNGLIAAAYLARAGMRTAVFERREIVGGACVTEEIADAPGFRVSTGAAQVGNLRPEIIADLELVKYGFELLLPDPLTVFPYTDGDFLALWRDRAWTLDEIARFSAHDAKAVPAFFADCATACDIIEPMLYRPTPTSLHEVGQGFDEHGRSDLFHTLVIGSAADLLNTRFEADEVRAALGFTSTFGTNAGPSTEGTAYVLLHHLFGATSGARGVAGYVRGGMGGLASALAAAATHQGAHIHTGIAVTDILIEHEHAAGVVTSNGEEFRVPVIVSGADPVNTFKNLLGHEHVGTELLGSVDRISTRGVAAKVNCALDALPSFTQLPKNMTPARVSIAPSLDYIEAAWREADREGASRAPFMTVHMQSVVDSTLAPEGQHTLTCYAQYFPYVKQGTAADAEAERHTIERHVLATVAQFAPDLSRQIIGCEVMSAYDLETRFAMTGAHQFHGDMLSQQLFDHRPVTGCAGARTLVDGLYLCSAGTHPGGCIWGAPGQLAANAVIQDRITTAR